MKGYWENFEIIWRNYKIIILGTCWKFLGKYVGKQILSYLRETLKKWKFGENFWEILDWLCRSILNIFMKSRKNFKKLLKNYGVNVKLILGKLWGNIRVILYYLYFGNYKEISKIFLWNFSNCEENLKKRWEYFVEIF